MLPFLMQEGVSEVLVNFITRIDAALLPQPASVGMLHSFNLI